MAKNYYDFLSDTSVFLDQIPPTQSLESMHEAWGQIHQSLQKINEDILDLGQEDLIGFTLGVEVSQLRLGHLGDYTIESRAEPLSVVNSRLQALATSNRFQRAIHGFWPA